MNHACPACGTTTARRGRCASCTPKATPAQNRAKRQRATWSTVYDTKRWRELRLRILHRDKHTCQACGEHGTTVGHIRPFTDYRDPLAWDTTNLRCECIQCNSREAGRRAQAKRRSTVAA